MQSFAKKYDEEKNMKLYGRKEIGSRKDEPEKEDKPKNAKFLKDLGKQVFLESEMNLDERINRRQHYLDRNARKE